MGHASPQRRGMSDRLYELCEALATTMNSLLLNHLSQITHCTAPACSWIGLLRSLKQLCLVALSGERSLTHTHTHTHTHKSKSKAKAKVSSYHKGHAYLAKPGHLCTKQVLCAGAAQSPGAGQGTRRSTNCVSHCRCGHPNSHRRL